MADCKIKFCGLKTEGDVALACDCGVWAVGFNLTESPRHISLEQCKHLSGCVEREIVKVGVFTTESADYIRDAVDFCSLDLAQVVADYSIEEWAAFAELPLLRVFQVSGPETLEQLEAARGRLFLLDTHVPGQAGGTGKTFDWALAREAAKFGQVLLAGGLNPENVSTAISVAEPWGVDVSSGIETSRGVKGHELMKAFAEAVKNAP